MNETKRAIFSMLTESTGRALCDSGDAYGRHWERNSKRTIEDFENDPEVSHEMPRYWYTMSKKSGEFVRRDKTRRDLVNYAPEKVKTGEYVITLDKMDTSDIEYTVSLFHYLPSVLELDDLCREYNAIPCEDWDGDAYGVSKAGEQFLKDAGLDYGNSWNSYNGECTLSQTIQGTELHAENSGGGEYVLLQIHNGCDVRGGYTNARLFKYQAFQEYINSTPYVTAQLVRKNGETVDLDTGWDGITLTQDGDKPEIKRGDKLAYIGL